MSERSDERVPRHPIGVVAERTGLSTEVLRVWERRYGVVEPARAEGGQRLYSDADIERLRLLRRATVGGRSIGRVARLSPRELARLVHEDEEARAERPEANGSAPPVAEIGQAVDLARALDGVALEALLRRTAAVLGVPRFLDEVAAPYLRRLGDGWHAGSVTPGQEHLGTQVVQRVVMTALADLRPPEDAPSLLVAGPAGERHEMGALLVAATAATEGWRVVYLGSDLPAGEIAAAARASRVAAVGMSVVFVEDPSRTAKEIREVRSLLPASVPLLVGGRGSAPLAARLSDPGIRLLADLAALRALLQTQGKKF